MATQEYGRTERDASELGGYRLLCQPFAGGRRSPAIISRIETEAKSFVGVQFSRHAVVVELRQYVAMSLHLPHTGSSDTEYSVACQEASRMISKARTHSLKPAFFGMDSFVEFSWPSDTMIGEHSLGFRRLNG